MSVLINADTSDGLKFTSDTSGEIKLQSAGTDIATVNSSGITMASGKTISNSGISTGPVLEHIASMCDGSSITTDYDTYTIGDVTTSQALTTTFTDVTGSSIAYTPPTGTKKVIYKFHFLSNKDASNAHFPSYKLLLDADEITNARSMTGGTGEGGYSIFEFVFNINGTTNNTKGHLASWTSDKTIKLQARELTTGASRETILHETVTWEDNESPLTPQFHVPKIEIIALKY